MLFGLPGGNSGASGGWPNPFDTDRSVCYIITHTAEVVELVDTLA